MVNCKHPDCFYRAGNTNLTICCNYLYWIGELRGCPADHCDKYLPREEARKLKLKRGVE